MLDEQVTMEGHAMSGTTRKYSPPSTTYRPLDSKIKEIRLLQVLPELSSLSTFGNTEPIQCILSYVSLDDKPQYHALSYTWENTQLGTTFKHPDDDQVEILIEKYILLDGQPVEVKSNLWVALWHFRRSARWHLECLKGAKASEFGDHKYIPESECWMSSDSYLWVDSLCICQSDNAERREQVALMGTLYKEAVCVHCWLGPAQHDVDVDAIIELMDMISERVFHIHNAKVTGTSHTCELNDELTSSVLSQDKFDHLLEIEESGLHSKDLIILPRSSSTYKAVPEQETTIWPSPEHWNALNDESIEAFYSIIRDHRFAYHWSSLAAAFKNPYWERLWIVQEFVLGRRVVVHFGLRTLNFLFTLIGTGLNYSILTQQNVLIEDSMKMLRMQGWVVGCVADIKFEDVQERPMLDMLRLFSTRKAFDPRDTIYGLLGICQTLPNTTMVVDYTQSVEETYKHAARYMIQTSSTGLDLISNPAKYYCKCINALHLSISILPSWVPDWRCANSCHNILLWDCTAASNMEHAARFWDHNSLLTCKGLYLGTIKSIRALVKSPFDFERLVDNRVMSEYLRNLAEYALQVIDDICTPRYGVDPRTMAHINIILSTLLSFGDEFDSRHLIAAQYESVLGTFYDVIVCNEWNVEWRLGVDAISKEDFVEICSRFSVDTLPESSLRRITSFFKAIEQASGKAWSWRSPFILEPEITVGADHPHLLPPELQWPFLGVAYPFCEAGDVVAIIYGRRLAVVLRPDPEVEGRFKVMCDAYVDGLMEGEAIGNFKVRDFELS